MGIFWKEYWLFLELRLIKIKIMSKQTRRRIPAQKTTQAIKTRKLKIEDFGMQLVPDGQLKDTMSEYEYKKFMEWMIGQTCSPYGVYRYDLERYLNGANAMHL